MPVCASTVVIPMSVGFTNPGPIYPRWFASAPFSRTSPWQRRVLRKKPWPQKQRRHPISITYTFSCYAHLVYHIIVTPIRITISLPQPVKPVATGILMCRAPFIFPQYSYNRLKNHAPRLLPAPLVPNQPLSHSVFPYFCDSKTNY